VAVPSDKFYQAKIVERRDFSDDLWSVRMKAEGEFKFTPGQYATFGVVEDNKVIERPYSIVSSPYEDTMEFFFELVPEGELTSARESVVIPVISISRLPKTWQSRKGTISLNFMLPHET